MVEEEPLFAFGTFTTDAPFHDETCECPLSEAFGLTFNEADDVARSVARMYDDSVRHYLHEQGANASERTQGNIPESLAQKAWADVLELSLTQEEENVAHDVAVELGWDTEIDHPVL
jgi:hypothetical protein